LIGPTVVPVLDTGSAPLQPSEPSPPLAAHAVAPLVDQASDVDCPVSIVAGDAVNAVTLGAGGALATSTVTDSGALLPPGPVQVNVYIKLPTVLIGPTVIPVLDTPTAPFQLSAPLPPLAVHVVALVVDQAIEVDCPATRLVGDAFMDVMLAAGDGALLTLTMTELGPLAPPAPLQLSV